MLFKSKQPRDRFFWVVITGLFLALVVGGGAAVAAELITGEDIADGTVTKVDIKDNNLTGTDLKDGSVGKIDITDNSLTGTDLNDGSVGTNDIKDNSLTGADLKDGSVGSADLAPDAVAFPNSLWGTMLRNQSGAAESQVQAGPGGQPLGDGSLRLFVAGNTDTAAFGNSFDFAGFELADITSLSYWTYNPDPSPAVRPSLRIEINPHLVADDTVAGVTEFTTLIHAPANGTTGWVEHAGILDDPDWYLTGQEGTDIGCTQQTPCTFATIRDELISNVDDDVQPPAISSGVYFGLGAGTPTPTEIAVDAFIFNGFEFDFESTGVFLTPVTP